MFKSMLIALAAMVLSLLAPLVGATALSGHDPVAYFSAGKPIKGIKTITHQYRGQTYQFSSTANRDTFAANPQNFLPQYDGYCAWAVAQGQLAPGDPAFAKVVNNKLYFNFDRDIAARWEKDIPGFIKSGDAHWPKIRK